MVGQPRALGIAIGEAGICHASLAWNMIAGPPSARENNDGLAKNFARDVERGFDIPTPSGPLAQLDRAADF